MCKSFECKLKGRLGRKSEDLKEMRVLNRIVRIDDHGLRYEADPRHAELLARSLNLEQCRHVVTPGVKEPYDEESSAAHDGNLDDHIPNGSINTIQQRERLVKFNNVVEFYDVPTQLDNYGSPPYTFDFDKYGRKLPKVHRSKEEYAESVAHDVSPNTRRAILDFTLRHGAAWETPSVELLAKLTKAAKKKYLKARMGTKAAKQSERLECSGDLLDEEASTMFRALAARYLYLSMDRPECAFSSKELCRQFATPTRKGVQALKRAVRFLVGMPRMVYCFNFQPHVKSLSAYVDTDFGGCHVTRRSTSGGVAMRGDHCIKHWSVTQSTVALSSGEAELGGICRGASIGLSIQSLAADLGITLDLEVLTDATAAIGICRRRGLGKIQNLATADLWVQDRIRRGDFKLTKVPSADNPADMLTKHVARDTMHKHMQKIGIMAEDGRAKSAPTIEHR